MGSSWMSMLFINLMKKKKKQNFEMKSFTICDLQLRHELFLCFANTSMKSATANNSIIDAFHLLTRSCIVI